VSHRHWMRWPCLPFPSLRQLLAGRVVVASSLSLSQSQRGVAGSGAVVETSTWRPTPSGRRGEEAKPSRYVGRSGTVRERARITNGSPTYRRGWRRNKG
jgi:hypothetical protein